MSGGRLAGERVLVTRPAERAGGLVEAIAAAGGEPVAFPVLEIVPRAPDAIADPAAFAVVLFVSPAAVEHGIGPLGLAPERAPRLGAVGPATAAALERAGFRVDIRPEGAADSEGLLDHQALQADSVRGRRVLVVRGVGGREHLAARLVERGAAVEYAEVYRRQRPSRYDPERAAGCDILTATSVEGLDNLLAMIPPAAAERLLRQPLAVAAPRIGEHARARGFSGPIASAEQPGDEGMLGAIARCADCSRDRS